MPGRYDHVLKRQGILGYADMCTILKCISSPHPLHRPPAIAFMFCVRHQCIGTEIPGTTVLVQLNQTLMCNFCTLDHYIYIIIIGRVPCCQHSTSFILRYQLRTAPSTYSTVVIVYSEYCLLTFHCTLYDTVWRMGVRRPFW